MAEKDPKSPATTSTAYDVMVPRWHVIDTLLGGTEAMRGAGETYLPKHERETDTGYMSRLQRTTLTNYVEWSLDTLSGKPFSEPVKIGDDVPQAIKDQVLMDVDLQGNNLNVFCRQWFRAGLAKAFAHILIEFPRPQPRPDGQPRTLEDDRKEGIRPYWVMIQPERLLFARAEVIDGIETLKHVRILESVTVQDGFAEKSEDRIRVLEPGTVTIYKPVKKGQDRVEWVVEDTWPTGMDYIPLVTFYAARESLMTGKPPLLDLAWLNVSHWQSSSDQRHILTVTRFPILACSGASAEDSDPVVVGPNQVLYNPDPQGKFYYVEHTGAAIEAGRKDQMDLEERMGNYGAQFLRKRPGSTTATARALDSAEQSSDLAAIAGLFEDAVAQALDITAEWMKLNADGGTIELIKDYDEQDGLPEMQTLQAARDKRDISRKTYLEALRSRGILPEDFDADEDWDELVEESSQLFGLAQQNLDAGQGQPGAGGEPGGGGSGEPGSEIGGKGIK